MNDLTLKQRAALDRFNAIPRVGSNSHHTGATDSVFEAISAGCKTRVGVMRRTRLGEAEVINAVKRLKYSGKITESESGYFPVDAPCLLAQAWR